MAEEPKDSKGSDKEEARARMERGWGNLRPATKGEVRNPEGKNGYKRRQELVAAILEEPDDDQPLEPGCTRIRSVVLAAIRDAKSGEPGAAAAQKLCVEQFSGKARQQIDLSSEDGSMSPSRADAVAAVAIALLEAAPATEPDDGNPSG